MNKIIIMKGGVVLFTLEGYFIPNVGEAIWFDASVNNPTFYEIESRVIDLDKDRKRFTVTLLVK